MVESMSELEFELLKWPDEAERAAAFLAANRWPHHGQARLSRAEASAIRLEGEGVETHWLRTDGRDVGIERLLDVQLT